MKKYIFLSIIIFSLFSCKDKEYKSLKHQMYKHIEAKIDTLHNILNELENTKDEKKIISNFKESRKTYKKIESFVEYYFQGLSRRINGPALPEIKLDDNIINDASGFQVIEEIIFNQKINFVELKKQVRILKTDLNFVQQNMKDLPIQEHHFYELTQHQIIRIATLGITGLDSPVALNSIEEAKYSIEGIEESYQKYCENNDKKINITISNLSKKARAFIIKNNDFSSFNRLKFIKNHLMPLSIAFENEFKSVIEKTPNFETNKVFYGHLADLMRGEKLNPDAFSSFAESKSTPEKIALGKVLFNDSKLSKNSTMSCATCHSAEKAFTDEKKTSITKIHNNNSNRNSPSLLYTAFQKSFFYDMSSQDLENQIESVMKNPNEFNLTPKEIKEKMETDKNIIKMFKKAFPSKNEITPYEIRNAIASYVRSLIPFHSKIDYFFAGKTTLTASESNGFNLFSGKAKCATCHFIPLYSGTIPPWYNNSESEVIGVPKYIEWQRAVIDTDEGRYKLNKLEPLKYSFKTPSIRNITKTSPYMHNGIYNTLDEVIKFYELGGGNGIGMKLEYQTLPFDHLKLSDKEKKDIINFLKCLTDEKN